jgi:DNA repair protein RadC
MILNVVDIDENKSVTTPAGYAEILQAILKAEPIWDQDKEHLWVIGLNSNLNIKYIDLVYLGTLTECPAHPREIFRLAIMQGAAKIIIAHNHPSGNLAASRDDKDITKRMLAAGELIGIDVLDHIIIGNNGGHISYAANEF